SKTRKPRTRTITRTKKFAGFARTCTIVVTNDDEHSAEIQFAPLAAAVAFDAGDAAGHRPGGGGVRDGDGAGARIDGDLRQHGPSGQLARPPERRAGRIEQPNHT